MYGSDPRICHCDPDRMNLCVHDKANIAKRAKVTARDTGPEHYNAGGNVQPWDIWEEFNLNPWAANVIKYVCRAGSKPKTPALDDYKKAAHYLQYLIEREEGA